jgi:hypothetical protein
MARLPVSVSLGVMVCSGYVDEGKDEDPKIV